ncbi:pyocin knob domain-containing protein [Salinicola socius]|uniref:Tail fiber protein n=1 Tax=Salinicola socius TaxID=404433 RepID=A0A1Q8SV64_9GAMM|nr:pyocin knob domain-containing protein [Salinicola socius]OLO05293.1 hypothetical protein BTW07_04490 [Salinicola socius]
MATASNQDQLNEVVNGLITTVENALASAFNLTERANDGNVGLLASANYLSDAGVGDAALLRNKMGFVAAALVELKKYGVGNVGAQPTWYGGPNLDQFDMDSDPTNIPAGCYRATSTLANRPGGSGTIYCSGYNSGVTNILYLENDDDDPRAWTRSYVNATWSAWKEIAAPKVYSNSNGWVLRLPNRIQVCVSPLLTLRYDNGNRLGTDWSFPAGFSNCFVVLPAADWGSIASARMLRATLRGDTSPGNTGCRIAAWSGYGESFNSDDTYPECRGIAIGVY